MSDQPWIGPKWEYFVLGYSTEDVPALSRQLDDLGEEGWEATKVLARATDGGMLLLKRPKPVRGDAHIF